MSFNLGGTVNDWTIEAWLYPIEPVGGFTSNYYVLMDTRLHGPGIAFFLGNNIASGIPYSRIGFYEEDVGLGSYSTNTVNYNSWNHVALVRSGTTYTYYINGISSGSGTRTFNNHSGSIAIASQKDRSFAHNWEGYIDDFRITKSAVYSASFTPPTSALTVLDKTILLMSFDTDFSDSAFSASVTAYGTNVINPVLKFGASAYFNNNGYLTVNEGTASFNLGGTVNNWTVEAWIYPIEPAGGFSSSDSSYYILFDGRPLNSAGQPGFSVSVSNTYPGRPKGAIGIYDENYGEALVSSSGVTHNAWNHLAIVRSGTTVTCYINGISSGSNAFTFSENTHGVVSIATQKDTSFIRGWIGYIDDFRITKSAVYSGNFTPPTAALTVLGQTILLLNFDTDFSDSSSSGALTTTHGTTVRRSNIEKFGASAYFNNNGYLEVDGR